MIHLLAIGNRKQGSLALRPQKATESDDIIDSTAYKMKASKGWA
jgi:hypothetical protein